MEMLNLLISKSREELSTVSAMSEEEMRQHSKLCLKLSVENKINMKNAFGLHLIGIMPKLLKKTDKTDLQQASLSLQASSKIFSGRVDALYKDTLSFHGQLLSIMADGKKGKKNAEDESDGEEDGDDNHDGADGADGSKKGQIKPQKNKCKSFLKSEKQLKLDRGLMMGEPHGNFSAINLACSTSRLNPKLLETLQLSNDSCTLRCAIPEKCVKEENKLTSVPFGVTQRFEGHLEKLRNFNVSQSRFQTLLAASNPSESTRFTLNVSTPRAASSPATLFNDDNDSVFIPPDVNTARNEDIESAREQFDVMNITAEVFVKDIAGAITDQGLDETLLAPNSTVKKVLDKSRRSSKKPSKEEKSTKKKIVHEPFFAGKSAYDIKYLFLKSKPSVISQKVLMEWSIEDTTNIDVGYELLKNMESRKEQVSEQATTLDEVLRVIKKNDLQNKFKYYYNKQSQAWKFDRRKLCLDDSAIDCANQTEKRMASLGGGANNPESLALSFQNLSIHDSIHEELPNYGEKAPDNEDLGATEYDPSFNDPEDQAFDLPEPFENDIEQLLVKPPDLVKPSCMKYNNRPVTLNTEKIKLLMWKIISKHLEVNNSAAENVKEVMFSAVYEELKMRLEREISELIAPQYAFTVLLMLGNEKILQIENIDTDDGDDISIKQDISEIEVSENM